ncbi:transposase [Ornithinibacter aureus]|nr:transposase [Ornithinibacter aureus]
MTWWAQRSALPRTRRVGRCRGGCAGGRCCTCRSGIRTALPDARIAVDKWHLVALANLMVTQVRQRITRQLHGRRGTATDKVWASRQLLLTGYEHLTVKQKARFNAALAAEDPTEAPWVSFRGWTGAGAVVVG